MITEIKAQKSEINGREFWLASCFSSISGVLIESADTEHNALAKLQQKVCGLDEDWPKVEYADPRDEPGDGEHLWPHGDN